MRSWIVLASTGLALLIVISSGFVMLQRTQPSVEVRSSDRIPIPEPNTPLPGRLQPTHTSASEDSVVASLAPSRDSLQTLFTHLQQQFRTDSGNVEPHMISSIQRLVSVVNSVQDTVFVVDLFESSGELARSRATSLGNMLRLHGLRTGALRITGYPGRPTIFVSIAQPES